MVRERHRTVRGVFYAKKKIPNSALGATFPVWGGSSAVDHRNINSREQQTKGRDQTQLYDSESWSHISGLCEESFL